MGYQISESVLKWGGTVVGCLDLDCDGCSDVPVELVGHVNVSGRLVQGKELFEAVGDSFDRLAVLVHCGDGVHHGEE